MRLAKNIGFNRLLLVAALLCLNGNLISQETDSAEMLPSHFVALNYHYGMLLPHHNEVAYLNQQNITGLEASWFIQTNGKRDWERAILLTIEDTLRQILILENDSAWMNSQLVFLKSRAQDSTFYRYKLVEIGQKYFYEGPHQKIFDYSDSIKILPSKYGDSIITLIGKKVYTYIGNSSRGYYYTYHLVRIDKLLSNTIEINSTQNSKEFEGTLSEHLLLAQNLCVQGHDMERGLACPQCLHTYKMNYDSAYRTTYKLDSTIKANSRIHLEDCNHGHICCETSFCDCCPDHLRKKFNKPLESDSTKMNKNPSLTVAQRHTKEEIKEASVPIAQSKCAHSHDCCRSNCECCPSLTKKERRKLIRSKKRTYRKNMRNTWWKRLIR